MNDRELLELAAKAAGVKLGELYGELINITTPTINPVYWHPLNDDGDAFRLAVSLDLLVDSGFGESYSADGTGDNSQYEPHGDDKYAATRRAIVRAAAEIGMKL